MATLLNHDYGPARDEIEVLIAMLPGIRWLEPRPDDIECQLAQLVADHCEALAHYSPSFETVPLKILNVGDGDAARAAAWNAAWNAAWAAARAATRDAAHLVGLPDAPNPWRPLIEMWALGVWPIGMVDGEFLVAVPRP